MLGNKTVDTSQCKPETLLYTSDECNKQPCGEGKNKLFLLYENLTFSYYP
jgi:hypothetical protein